MDAKNIRLLEKPTKISMDIDDIHIPEGKDTRLYTKSFVNDIAKSLKTYGFLKPIVIDDDNNIVLGIGKYLAAKKLGLKFVPCVRE